MKNYKNYVEIVSQWHLLVRANLKAQISLHLKPLLPLTDPSATGGFWTTGPLGLFSSVYSFFIFSLFSLLYH